MDAASADSITDPTDWASTAVASLQPLESALRCQVCKEFFTNPVITSCAHTFCSICIRRCLTHDGKCPTCRADDQPVKLRRNAVVEEVVGVFQSARPEMLRMGRDVAMVRQGGMPVGVKRKAEDISGAEGEDGGEDEVRRSRTRRSTRERSQRARRVQAQEIYEISDGGSDYVEEADVDDGKVECPICMQRMKVEEVSPHIDRAHADPPAGGPARSQPAMFGLQRDPRSPSNGIEVKTPERLGGLSYGILNEQALRKKLQSLGIPTHGNKQALINRHQEWLNIWNANCDSTKPRPKRELLRDLDVWERTQGSQARGTSDANGIMSKDFNSKAWTQSNGTDFKNLVAQARAKRTLPSSAQTDPKPGTPQVSSSANGSMQPAESSPNTGEEG